MLAAGGLIVAAVLAAGIIYRLHGTVPTGDLRRADAWTVLQGVEASERAAQDPHEPVFMENAGGSKYTLLGLPTGDAKFPLAWIILNESSADGFLKMVPKVRKVQVSCAYVEGLMAKTAVTPGAARYLKSACT
ncbi:MAG: hypothetical protein ACLP2F_09325 [Steroidobacteraceae bacterium]